MAAERTRVLFLCTGNSCRSQMGEGLLRHLAGERYDSLSAGAKPSGYVHPLAIEVMQELDIDISEQQSKSIQDFLPPIGEPPHFIISVCDSAAEECPIFPGEVENVHIPFFDPADATGTEEERKAVFRKVRDEIQAMIEERFVN